MWLAGTWHQTGARECCEVRPLTVAARLSCTHWSLQRNLRTALLRSAVRCTHQCCSVQAYTFLTVTYHVFAGMQEVFDVSGHRLWWIRWVLPSRAKRRGDGIFFPTMYDSLQVQPQDLDLTPRTRQHISEVLSQSDMSVV